MPMEDETAATGTVLVVDDNAENRALAEAVLEDEGYDVMLTSGGEQALEVFAGGGIDCVLLDVRMPGMDGFETCRRLRALPGGAETPIVFLTAIRDLDTFDEAQRAGADDFLLKPVRPTVLALRVQAALRLRVLSTELKDHYDRVRQQRDDLMRLQLQKERLMSFVVHDLKNPLHALDLHAQLLARNRSLDDRARRSVDAIRNEGRSLNRLILNLLDITKSDEGKLEPVLGRVSLQALCEEVVQMQASSAAMREVDLVSEVGQLQVEADADLLRRVLENLVDNALHHSPEGTTVRITAQECGDDLQLRVSDQGSGIPLDKRELIFERHARLADASATRSGRGLGLAFCKAAAVAHGGDIWVTGDEPGTTFCVRLPRRPSEAL